MDAIKSINTINDFKAGATKIMDRSVKTEEMQLINPDVFDENLSQIRKYGGNQSSITNEKYLNDKIIDKIINKYYDNSNLSVNEKAKLFKNMDINGCGYMAASNIIFEYTSDLSNQEFYDKFGFYRYDENGYYNYDYMFLDYFLSFNSNKTNNIRAIYDSNQDLNMINIGIGSGKQTVPQGSIVSENTDMLKKYLNQKGYNINISKQNNINNIDNYLNNGKKVIIGLKDFELNGYDKHINDLHTMVVTKSLGNNKYKVSSWGKCYEIDLSNYNYDNNKLDIGVFEKL